ncbi:energy-coupling factor ABC transporter ATP-binding protein [Furfurilactobacillus siliginis]|uniref:Cobalt transporter ATP-binding subunit n=1 Tax=Furfurilactobacillus siliginis TaxID=348151 RepID=A0A0R2LB63_9LACO|nr:energy-coupling factor ABC transporter ATP-binding protein [Furfurilactobacillus siliginis]KRN95684.1 cobalt transporter ATP-binding subunit [Furfurilactobacillus siliginis]GEK28054.1 energy-coupling factor transporter ATP-binding protein EcfA1 [Furfurilactobacillus siliginis]
MAAMIEVKNLTYHYPEVAQPALDHISLTVEQGEWVAIVGHNGSGKSTLVRAIDGLVDFSEGEVTVAGIKLTPDSVWDVRKQIGMVFQNPDNQFVGATVADDVAFGLENAGIPRDKMIQKVDAALKQVDMAAFSDREPSRLSGGQKQRVALAGIIAMNPSIIVLDEATSMLDPHGRQTVMDVITKLRQSEKAPTIISITHDLDEAARAQRLIVVNDGQQLATGKPAEIFANEALLASSGLAQPFSTRLARSLAQQGSVHPDHYLSDTEMEDWLWQSHLTM